MRISDWSSDVCSSDLDRQLLKVARESGIGDGFTVPRHLPGEATGSCSFAVAPNARIPLEMLHAAEIVGAVALAAARQLIGTGSYPPRAALTERQRECVLLSARGQTAGETASILGRSEERRVGKECGRTGRLRWAP